MTVHKLKDKLLTSIFAKNFHLKEQIPTAPSLKRGEKNQILLESYKESLRSKVQEWKVGLRRVWNQELGSCQDPWPSLLLCVHEPLSRPFWSLISVPSLISSSPSPIPFLSMPKGERVRGDSCCMNRADILSIYRSRGSCFLENWG